MSSNQEILELKYCIDRYATETKRLLHVLDQQLEGKEYVIGDELTIADNAIWPWIRVIDTYYQAGEFLQMESYANVKRWMATIEARPAAQRGIRVNSWGEDAVLERHSLADFEVK